MTPFQSDYERRIVQSALHLYLRYLERRLRANERNQWQARPGESNANTKRLNTVTALIARWHIQSETETR